MLKHSTIIFLDNENLKKQLKKQFFFSVSGRSETTDYQTDTFAPDTARSQTEDVAEESVQSEVSSAKVTPRVIIGFCSNC